MNRYNDDRDDFSEQHRKAFMNVLGKRIKRARIEKGFTQEFAAEKAGCNPKYLGEVENGKKIVGSLLLNKIASALDVPVCSLLSKDGCSCVDSDAVIRVGSLFAGRGQKDVKTALRIIEALFGEDEARKK